MELGTQWEGVGGELVSQLNPVSPSQALQNHVLFVLGGRRKDSQLNHIKIILNWPRLDWSY